MKAVGDGDSDVRKEACWALAKIGPAAAEAVPALIAALETGNTEAIGALRGIGPGAKGAVGALVKHLPVGDETDRDGVIDAIAAIGPDAKAALLDIQKLSGRRWDKERVAKALWKIGDADSAAEMLVGILQKNEGFTDRAIEVLGEMGPAAAKAVPALAVLADTDAKGMSEHNREQAIVALGKIGPAARLAIPMLIKALKTKDRAMYGEVSACAAAALGKIGPDAKEAVPALVRVVKRREYKSQPAAIIALAEIGGDAKQAVPVLEEYANNDLVRMPVAYALWKLDGRMEKPIEVAILTLKHTTEFTERRLLAVRLLQEMGPRAGAATNVLIFVAMKDADLAVRSAAAAALRQINPVAAEKAGVK